MNEVRYIACDLADDETLAEFRRRVATPTRRWWKLAGRRSSPLI